MSERPTKAFQILFWQLLEHKKEVFDDAAVCNARLDEIIASAKRLGLEDRLSYSVCNYEGVEVAASGGGFAPKMAMA